MVFNIGPNGLNPSEIKKSRENTTDLKKIVLKIRIIYLEERAN